MTGWDIIGLLNDVVGLAQEVIAKPIVDTHARRVRCKELAQKVRDGIPEVIFGRFLDNFAPLLLTAIDRALHYRQCNSEDEMAKWEALIGHLVPYVRSDAGGVLELMRRE